MTVNLKITPVQVSIAKLEEEDARYTRVFQEAKKLYENVDSYSPLLEQRAWNPNPVERTFQLQEEERLLERRRKLEQSLASYRATLPDQPDRDAVAEEVVNEFRGHYGPKWSTDDRQLLSQLSVADAQIKQYVEVNGVYDSDGSGRHPDSYNYPLNKEGRAKVEEKLAPLIDAMINKTYDAVTNPQVANTFRELWGKEDSLRLEQFNEEDRKAKAAFLQKIDRLDDFVKIARDTLGAQKGHKTAISPTSVRDSQRRDLSTGRES